VTVGADGFTQPRDPPAIETARQQLGSRVTFASHGFDALAGRMRWRSSRNAGVPNPDFARIKQLLKRPLIVDGRNLLRSRRSWAGWDSPTTASAVRSDRP